MITKKKANQIGPNKSNKNSELQNKMMLLKMFDLPLVKVFDLPLYFLAV